MNELLALINVQGWSNLLLQRTYRRKLARKETRDTLMLLGLLSPLLVVLVVYHSP